MLLNALGFVGRALYLMPDYLHNKPVDLLIDPDLNAEDFNDDTLGRCLDDLYTAGVTEVFSGGGQCIGQVLLGPGTFGTSTSELSSDCP